MTAIYRLTNRIHRLIDGLNRLVHGMNRLMLVSLWHESYCWSAACGTNPIAGQPASPPAASQPARQPASSQPAIHPADFYRPREPHLHWGSPRPQFLINQAHSDIAT